MGWCREGYEGHEGYLIAVERDENHVWREVRYPDRRERAVSVVQAGCACGWRSLRFRVPSLFTSYGPFIVIARKEDEDLARALWSHHLSEAPAQELITD